MRHNDWQIDDMSSNNDAYRRLAGWLRSILAPQPELSLASDTENDNEVVLHDQLGTRRYHLNYYRQLPDFVMALLEQHGNPQTLATYAPLLYHLASCPDCHAAYIDLYRALRPTLASSQTLPPGNHGVRAIAAIPADSLVFLCRSLISQAEAVTRQARHDHSDGSAPARFLLQQAMRFSASITQPGLRGQALADLVRVATLFDGPRSPGAETPATHAYAPLVGATGPRRGTGVVRRGGTLARLQPGTPAIYLQARHLDGSITQQDDMLELRLHDLDNSLRGHHLLISVPLGGLIEPVQWLGGNPKTIRSVAPVAPDGSLHTPLGATTLRISSQEERGLLEAMFMLLEVRLGD